MTEARFRVYGTPVPQGSKTVASRGGKIWLRDANPRLKKWRDLVTEIAGETAELHGWFTGAVEVEAIFYLPRPKTVKRCVPSVKPDIDKLVRALFDSMTKAALIKDDSLVVRLTAVKLYETDDQVPGVSVYVSAFGGSGYEV